MSKIGDPVAPPSFIEQTYLKHRKALTRSEGLCSRETDVILELVRSKVDEIVDDLFRYRLFTHRDPMPSLRASFDNKLSEAGAFGELLAGFSETFLVEPDLLYGITWTPRGGLVEIRFIPGDQAVACFQDYVDSLWMGRLDKPLAASPVPILEPLKVRIITKGQAAEYYRTLEMQKFMHSALRDNPIFQYIGHPIDDRSWVAAFGSKVSLEPGRFYVSGDYSAATDNLRPELSRYIWEAICLRTGILLDGKIARLVDTPYFPLGIKALCSHELHYPKGVVVNQTWGQLMGSPMSFPILCIANAAATLASQGWRFREDLPLRVNGDDIGFITDAFGYRQWREYTAACGLELSVGKNYTSTEFLIINSELRRPPEGGNVTRIIPGELEGSPDDPDDPWRQSVERVQEPRPWKLEGFLNQSILYHTVKKGVDAGKAKDVYWTDLESLSHEAIRGIPDTSQWKVLSIFLKEHASVLAESPPLSNAWFPKALGGMGLAIPAGKTISDLTRKYDSEILEKQRKLAAYLACDPCRRLKRVCRSKLLVGLVGEALDDVLKMSNAQSPMMLRNKPLKREQKTLLGGVTLLGYLLRGLGGLDGLGGELRRESLEDPCGRVHKKEAQFLVQKFRNWTAKALRTSLKPMGLEHVRGFQEHPEMFSLIELLKDSPTSRELDCRTGWFLDWDHAVR